VLLHRPIIRAYVMPDSRRESNLLVIGGIPPIPATAFVMR